MNEKGLNPQADSGKIDVDSLEAKEKINTYLAENLPVSEVRIAEKMDPECRVCVVIPCYGERSWVLRPLGSLAQQEGVKPEQFEAIFVINNPREKFVQDANETDEDYERRIAKQPQRFRDNKQVMKLFDSIKNGSSNGIRQEERKIVEHIRESGIKFHIIDKSTPGKELPDRDANVGGARNRGVAEAVERFLSIERNGIIAQTDADTKLSTNYVAKLIETFDNNPELVGMAGNLGFEAIKGKEGLPHEYVLQEEMRWVYKNARDDFLEREKNITEGLAPGSPVIPFSGANMASRAYESALAGGIPKIAGGEDPAFGRNVAKIGIVARIPEIITYPADRQSERTTTGHGLTRIKIRKNLSEKGGVQVEDFEMTKFNLAQRQQIERLIEEQNISIETLRPLFLLKGEQLIDDDQINVVVEYFKGLKKLPTQEEISQKRPIMKIAKAMKSQISKLCPEVSLPEAINRLLDEFLKDPLLAEKYKVAFAEYERKLREIELSGKESEKIPAGSDALRPAFIAANVMRNILENKE